MRRGFKRRSFGSKGAQPTRSWVSLNVAWTFNAVAVTSTSSLISLQAPTTLALTSDPPEDLTILRIKGDFSVSMSNVVATWVMALLVQDTTWTPSNDFQDDADKRILWSQTYANSTAAAVTYDPPGVINVGSIISNTVREATHIDIAPKVRLEAGKALYLVAYEQSQGATFTTNSENMRMLFQRSGRRSR